MFEKPTGETLFVFAPPLALCCLEDVWPVVEDVWPDDAKAGNINSKGKGPTGCWFKSGWDEGLQLPAQAPKTSRR